MFYRTDDPARWGVGKGSNLAPVEIDGNFWELAERLVAVEGAAGGAANGIENITVTGSQMTIFLEDGTALGPYTLPTAMIRYRGDWVSGAAYAELDLVAVPDIGMSSGIFLVLLDHTSDAAFDAGAEDAEGNPLYRFLFPIAASGGASALSDLADVDLATTAPVEGDVLGYDAAGAVWTPRAPTGGIADAPADGATYGRQDGAWTPIDTVVEWADIQDKPATFEPSAHAHTTADISNFAEALDDRVAALLVAGTNVTLTYDDLAGTLTIAAGGGGGTAGALNDLTDVVISAPATGQLLRYDGAGWVNGVVATADITGFAEAVNDRVAALLVAGANVTLTYDDATGALTIAAAGGVGGTAAFSGFRADKSGGTTQAIPAGGAVSVKVFAAELYDTEGAFGPATGRFTVPASLDGKYMVFVAGTRFSTSPATTAAYIYRNGTAIAQADGSNIATYSLTSGPVLLATGDVFDSRAWSSAATDLVASSVNYFAGFVVDPTGGLEDAPADGNLYGRADGAWTAIELPVPEGQYRYWRLRLTSEDQKVGSGSLWLFELEFRSAAGVQETAVGGAVISDGWTNPTNAFGTSRASAAAPFADKWIGYDFLDPKAVEEVLVAYDTTFQSAPTHYVIEASNDNLTWTTALEVNLADVSGSQTYAVDLAEPVPWSRLAEIPATVDALPAAVGADGEVLKAQADGSVAWRPAFQGFRASKNATQAVAAGGFPEITFQVEHFDTEGAFAANRFIVPAALDGKFMQFAAGTRLSGTPSSGNHALYIRRSDDGGTTWTGVVQSNVPVSDSGSITTGPLLVTAGQVFSAWIFLNAAQTLVGDDRVFFAGQVLG